MEVQLIDTIGFAVLLRDIHDRLLTLKNSAQDFSVCVPGNPKRKAAYVALIGGKPFQGPSSLRETSGSQ
jgi:hypothetical protein